MSNGEQNPIEQEIAAADPAEMQHADEVIDGIESEDADASDADQAEGLD